MHVQSLGVADVVGAPDAVYQLAAGEHSAAVAHQVLEKIKLLERQRDRLTIDRHDVTFDVHAHRTRLEHAVGATEVVGVGAAAQHRANAGDQLARGVRLGDVVVGAEFQPDDLVDLAVAGRHHDHRHTGFRPKLLAHVGAAHPRQHQVQQHDVGTGPVEFGERGGPVGDHRRLKSLLAQQECQRIGQRLLVLNNQHTGHGPTSSPTSYAGIDSVKVDPV